MSDVSSTFARRTPHNKKLPIRHVIESTPLPGNRHCPKCQAQARQRWLARREQDLLNVPYFHVVFTLPHQLNPLCQRHPRLLYDLLFRATAQTMLEVAANPRHLGAKIGFLAILHTWGQNLRLHPHLHCVVPAGGFDPTCSHWVHPRHPFFSR